MKKIWNFLKDEDGLELVEYAVMGALVVIVTVGAITLLGGAVAARFADLTGAVD
jgi:Flp pilus assembly pilin Flp